jgi:hypothetical protein
MRPAKGIDMTGHGNKKEASEGTASCRRKPRYTPSSPSVSLTIRQGRLRPGQRQTWADHARDQRCPPRLSATQAPIPPSGGRPRKKGKTPSDASPRARSPISAQLGSPPQLPGVAHRRPAQSKPRPQPGSIKAAEISRCTAPAVLSKHSPSGHEPNCLER